MVMLRSGVLAAGFVLAGCVPMAAPDVPVSTANLVSSSGAVLGTVRVFSEPTGVMLRIDATGVPAGQHGVHVHTTGRCDPPGFTSAGPHWNPSERKHGHRNPAGFHMGDLGNLGVGADGRLIAGLLVPQATIDALRDADGAALVLHAKADDEVTDPSGNSGDRIACAVL
jgi:superoxide dismutase, Cu-Zn family